MTGKLRRNLPFFRRPLWTVSHSNSGEKRRLRHGDGDVLGIYNSLFIEKGGDGTRRGPEHLISSPTPSSSSSCRSLHPDLASILASQRFFFSSPGRSNSIIDSAPSFTITSTRTAQASSLSPSKSSSCNTIDISPQIEGFAVKSSRDRSYSISIKDGVAVSTNSPDPYMDFRRSMQEMVEAREMTDVQNHWNSLHELLQCYLELNPKSTHKLILAAFSDLLVSLLPRASRCPM